MAAPDDAETDGEQPQADGHGAEGEHTPIGAAAADPTDALAATGEAGGQTGLQTATADAVTAPISPMRQGAKRGWRAAVMVMCIVVLIVGITTSLSLGGGISGLILAFTISSPTARATLTPTTPIMPTSTLPPTKARATATAKSTPALVGEGVPNAQATLPPYTGPIAGGQGCPGGQAPKPVGWAIHSASDYGAPKANVVALTFDDGPTPAYTPAILSYLEQTHTPATFFVLGQYAQAYPWLIHREAADGFTIGIHTWNHPNMLSLTPSQRAWQLAATAQQLHADLGANACLWLWRPPYGGYNGTIVAQAGTFGLTTIMWNDDPADWSQPGTMTIVNRVLSNVRPGSIILMHDGPAGRAQTLAALPYILAGLHQRGLTPVSLPQLLLGYPTPTPTPGPKATATPTHAPSPTPTDTPAPTQTDTPTPTPIPSPT